MEKKGDEITETDKLDHISNTWHKQDFRQFNEGVVVYVKIVSKSGKDVRRCHLRQDVIDKWAKHGDGRITSETKPKDYSSELKTNLFYGGSWFVDQPKAKDYIKNYKDLKEANEIQTHYFWQAKVTIEENPDVYTYWGWYAKADFAQKGADTNALSEKQTFGPLATRTDNPYLKK